MILSKKQMAICKRIMKIDHLNSEFVVSDSELWIKTPACVVMFKIHAPDIRGQVGFRDMPLNSIASIKVKPSDLTTLEVESCEGVKCDVSTYTRIVQFNRLLTENPSGIGANFDIGILGHLSDLAKLYPGNKKGYLRIEFNGENATTVIISPECFAIVAPIKFPETLK